MSRHSRRRRPRLPILWENLPPREVQLLRALATVREEVKRLAAQSRTNAMEAHRLRCGIEDAITRLAPDPPALYSEEPLYVRASLQDLVRPQPLVPKEAPKNR